MNFEIMALTTNHNRLINRVIDRFDFNRVNTVMKALNWPWIIRYSNGRLRSEIPSIEELKKQARSLLEYAASSAMVSEQGECTVTSGGFEVVAKNNGNRLVLKFVVEEWEEGTNTFRRL